MLIGKPYSLNWKNQENLVFPASDIVNLKPLEEFIDKKFHSHILIRTSGSTNQPKWVALSKKAILTSAAAVNKHLCVTASDKWFLALPTEHIGGLSILARSYLSHSHVDFFNYKWSPNLFVEQLKKFQSTLTSLVPTQVYDLVAKELSPPQTLRCVLVGGGGLLESIYLRGRELGWPLLPSYGLTECASQVATASINSLQSFTFPFLEILPHVTLKIMENNRLSIESEALFSGYIEQDDNNFKWLPNEGKTFLTEDLGEVQYLKNASPSHLKILGRVGHTKKIKGFLVNSFNLNQEFQSRYGIERGEILILPDTRKEHHLALISESREIKKTFAAVEQFNTHVSKGERISKIYFVDKIPRTELGKPVRLNALILGLE